MLRAPSRLAAVSQGGNDRRRQVFGRIRDEEGLLERIYSLSTNAGRRHGHPQGHGFNNLAFYARAVTQWGNRDRAFLVQFSEAFISYAAKNRDCF